MMRDAAGWFQTKERSQRAVGVSGRCGEGPCLLLAILSPLLPIAVVSVF